MCDAYEVRTWFSEYLFELQETVAAICISLRKGRLLRRMDHRDHIDSRKNTVIYFIILFLLLLFSSALLRKAEHSLLMHLEVKSSLYVSSSPAKQQY